MAFPLQMLLIAAAQTLGVGGASLLSRSLGAERRKRAETDARNSFHLHVDPGDSLRRRRNSDRALRPLLPGRGRGGASARLRVCAGSVQGGALLRLLHRGEQLRPGGGERVVRNDDDAYFSRDQHAARPAVHPRLRVGGARRGLGDGCGADGDGVVAGVVLSGPQKRGETAHKEPPSARHPPQRDALRGRCGVLPSGGLKPLPHRGERLAGRAGRQGPRWPPTASSTG